MNLQSKVFLRKKFKDYYFRNRVSPPPEVARREFGVGTLEDKIKSRHKTFSSPRELDAYLRAEAPFYISYSAAYYEFPANTPMEAKNWLGADLVFDLDAPMKFLDERQLANVKQEALNLLDFLANDFGFSKDVIQVNFSGSKGYHVHVYDERARKLSGDQRREIVDYVTGTGLDIHRFMKEVPALGRAKDRDGVYAKSTTEILGPGAGVSGWAGRLYNGVLSVISETDRSILKRIKGVGDKTADEIIKNREKNIKSLSRGKWTGLIKIGETLQEKIINDYAVKMTGDTDKMVTIDTSRIMRLPDTLHGGTGLKAAIAEDLDSFDPCRDAVVFGSKEVKIKTLTDIPKFRLRDGFFGPLKESEEAMLPEYASVYLVLKHAAEIAG